MRSKEKVPTRYEILKNFTREFLLEEKRRCEIDRYVTDFRILIHKSPHENHNYLNRLLQDYTTMFLSHERISANKMNQEGATYQLKSQLASRKKDSPKQRYVKSKLAEKNDSNSEHQSYLVLRAKTEDFLKKQRQYEQLEQIAYEIFIKNTNSEIKTYQHEIEKVIEPSNVLKLKSTDIPTEKPYKRHNKNVYVVNNPEAHGEYSGKQITNRRIPNSEKEYYEHLKKETEKFLANNRDYNDAEQKILSEQYKKNAYIKKYVDNLTSSEKSKKGPQTPKRGIYSKIKSMIGLSPENPTKFYKNVDNKSETLVDSTKAFLRNEKKYNNFEFEAYKLFYIKNGDFQNPLIEKIKLIAYDSSENGNKSKIKHLAGLKSASSNQRNSVKEEFEDFNTVKCSPTEKNEPDQKMGKELHIETTEKHPKALSKSSNEDDKRLRENTNHFLNKMRVYEDQQRYFFVIHLRKHYVNPMKEKKETLFIKIKHLFFGKHEKSKEKSNYYKEITQEFLKNEQYYYSLQTQAFRIFSEDENHYRPIPSRNPEKIMRNERSISLDGGKSSKVHESRQEAVEEIEKTIKKDRNTTVEKSATLKKRQKPNKTETSLHQRSKSEDLLMFKTRSKSLESKKSPTGHKTFSDRLKSMVGIGNRRRTRSRENISRLTDPVNYFLEHERFYYNGSPITEGKYSRSFSALETTTKDGTIKTRTKKFISTENVLYQDSNSTLASKPPSGRRRKQERNRDDKEKRRSRTLSPAQKLVSKIRNFVQKSSPDKTKAEPKGDNHGSQESSADVLEYKHEIPSSQGDNAMVNIKIDSPQFPRSVKSIEIEEVSVKAPEQTTSISNEKYDMNLEKSKKPADLINILDDPQLVKNHTRIFLHDIKRYHDMDKEPNAIDKTLIFINNKSDDNNPSDNGMKSRHGSSSEALKTVQLKSINKDAKNNEVVHEHTETFSENYRENQNREENATNIDTTENSSRKIIHNKVVKETKIIQKVTTHRVQQKSTNKIISHESKTTRTMEDIPLGKEHIYENVHFTGANQISSDSGSHTSNQESIKIVNAEHTTTETIPNQYHIHEVPLNLDMDLTQAEVKQSSAPMKREKSTMKETRPKTATLPKSIQEVNKPMSVSSLPSSSLKTGHKDGEADNEKNRVERTSKTATGQNNQLFRQYTGELSGDRRKHQDKPKEPSEQCTVVKQGKENLKPTTARKSKSQLMKPIVLNQEEELRLTRQNTDIFLKDHQDYHNKQRNEDNAFFGKIGKPENTIWLSSRPAMKKENIITKVKNLMSPQQTKKTKPSSEATYNKIIREQTDEFLRKHQYLIHREEVDSTRKIVPFEVEKEKITVETTEQQTSAPKRIEKSPEKEEKSKKNTFSKLRSFVSGSSKKPAVDESNALVRKQTTEFLDDMRKQHDKHKEVSDKYIVVWLSQQNLKPAISQTSKSDIIKPIVLTEQQRKQLRLIRQNTHIFLKDHQDYHNKQRNEDNAFLRKMGKTENMIWLSSRPAMKKENIITKVKHLMSPQQSKKTKPSSEATNNKIIREQTDEFLRKHQYLIHREEIDFTKKIVPFEVEKEKITVETTEQQTSAPKRIEKSPEKEEKSKKNTFSKLRSFVSGSSKKPAVDESNALVRKQTTEFLDDMRKQHDKHKEVSDKYKVVWLSQQNLKPAISQTSKSDIIKPIVLTEQQRKQLRLIRQNTDIFLKDHQDYHNKQRNEDNAFFGKMGKPENLIWLSSRPAMKKENIITKVKNLMSPQQSKKTKPSSEVTNNKIIREQTDEFLRKHQYLIHREEIDFTKKIVPFEVEKEKITVETTEQQTSAPKRIEKSPEKEEKSKKNTFSKLRSFVSGSSKKPAVDESNVLLRKQTTEFLDDMRKQHDKHKEVSDKYKVVWLSQQNLKAAISPTSKSDIIKPLVLTEQQREQLRLIRQNTDIFLKDHKDYHNKQRNEDNAFFGKIGKPENAIWLSSRPAMKKENIITKVKNLMSPQQSKKTKPSSEVTNNKIIREQTDEFLRKHQYLIHREEIDFTKKIVPFEVEKEKITVETTKQQTSAPKRIEKSPEKEEKSKKNTFSKLRSFVSGSSKKPAVDESNALVRKQTTEFLDDMRKQHDKHKEVSDKYKVVWLSQQNLKPAISQTSKSDIIKPIVLTEQQREQLRFIRQNTDIFLKDHQDYHNKQRNEDNAFFGKMGKPENLIWLSSRPAMKKENIITKVKNLMSPQQSKKTKPSSEVTNNKIIREQTDEFLRKHQYLIHREEIDFTKKIVPFEVEKEKITVETTEQQTSAPKRIEKSPEKEEKSKKNTFSKLRSFVSGSSKKPAVDESNVLLRKQTTEFLDDMRKQHDKHKEVSDKYKVVWLSQQNLKAAISPTSKSDIIKPIVSTEQQREQLRLIRQNTDIFLKDHKDYHNKQRNEDNAFFGKMGKPENLIWLSSRPAMKKENIITKVKNLMSPQQSKKTKPSSEVTNNKIIREQTDEFLRKHQYLIHREEIDFTKKIVPFEVEKEKITVETTEKQTSAPKRIEKSPEKEEKSKKNTFSKLRSFVSGSSKKPAVDESNALVRKQTTEFLDDMRKQHDKHKEVSDKYKVVWLSQQNLKAAISPTSKSDIIKPLVLTEQQREQLRFIRQNTDIFLKDHQDYHNKQRNEDNAFFGKMGKPENLIWLSSRPAMKKENIITKVKNLMSPQQSKKTKPSSEVTNNKIIREQTDEFLRKHQYLIHREEIDFTKKIVPFEVEKEKITVETTEQQTSAPKRIEKSPEKEEKSKKNTFSKLRSFVSGSSKKPAVDESNVLLRKQTTEFLDDMRKQHDKHKEVSDKYKVVWLSQQNLKPAISQTSKSDIIKPIVSTEQQREQLRLIRQNTDIFLKDHQDYHNKQRNEDNAFFGKMGKPENLIWLSSRPAMKKENIITKVKNLMSPQQSKKTKPSSEVTNNKIIREQTDEFLRKHQYLIHREEIDFTKKIVPFEVEKEKITVETTEQQTSAPKRIEKSPEKEEKSKKNTFSKLRSFVSGSSKKPAVDESNALVRKQTTEFLDDMRKQHDKHKEVSDKYKVVWLSQQNLKPAISPTSKSDIIKPIVSTEQQREQLRLIRQNTDIFLKDHKDYHNKQRNEDNAFFGKMGKSQNLIWLSSRPAMKKENIITKVKNLMSPQQSKKTKPLCEVTNNKIIREQTDEFLRKHQYLIHREEIDFTKKIVPFEVEKEKITVETTEQQTSAPKRIEKSPEKEEKSKKNTFSKLRSFVSGSSKKPAVDESNALVRKQTTEFLDDMRKQHDKHKEVSDKYKVVWLSQQNLKPAISQTSKSDIIKPIVLTEQQREQLRLIRQNTDIFLKDHQDYHNKQRNEDNAFFGKMGKPENLIWLSSRPAMKKENIITKVKNLMSPQQSKKTKPSSEVTNNKIIREQTDEFLRKHQYLIHREEIDFTKKIVPFEVEKEKITVETTEQQTSAPKRIEKSPEKEEKSKKNTFSKLRSFVSGSSKKPAVDESNVLLRKQTTEFLDDMRKQHDKHKEVSDKYKVVWLSQQNLKPAISPTSKSDIIKPIVSTEQQREQLRLIRQNTDIFLKDHKDYHNKQRNEDNAFFGKMGKPENLIWLSSRPAMKKENIITKVKNLMSPQQSKKTKPLCEVTNNKIIREQTDEFLRKHQYLIHREEIDFTKKIVPFEVEKEKITVETTEQQTSAPKRIEKSPEKEEKSKKYTFSKLRSFVSGSSKKPAVDESNALVRKQTTEFLDDMRKQHDKHKEVSDKYKVVWLSQQNLKPAISQTSKSDIIKPIVLTEQQREQLRLIRQNTDIFLKDHQDYHNKQRNEDNAFFGKMGKPENFIWLSSRPAMKKENIITKVKNLMSPQQSKKTKPSSEATNYKIIREQTDEFLKKHQYLIHREEIDFTKKIVPFDVEKEKITVETTEQQTSAPKRIEKSPEKEEKSKKNTFSKLRSFVSGSSKKPAVDESNALVRKQTTEFLDNMRKQHDKHKEVSEKYKVVWLSQQNLKPAISQISKSDNIKPVVLTEQEREQLRLIRQNTDIFLKDHQDYHNKQRNEDNAFLGKMGKPENMIWFSSRPAMKKENIISKVKNLMSPQQSKKTKPSSEATNNKIIREQTDEFLRKHQYLIHREEIDFTRKIVPFEVEKEKITVETTEQQTSAPKRIEKSPEKEEKSKKNTFSKLRSFVSGSSKKPAVDESNALVRKQTTEFLDDMRKQHDKHKEVSDKYKVVWLSQQNLKPAISQISKSDNIKPVVLTEQQREQLRLIRQNTDIFLKDHQDYHNKQRNEDNTFLGKMGKPDNMIWLSSRPAMKKENIITKVKNLMSPQQSKKTKPSSEATNNKIIREQTDEFLRKHQYLIHREEIDFTKKIVPFEVEKQKITVETTEQETSAPKRIEKSPEKEEKSKKNTFSKLKSLVSGPSKKQSVDECNALLRKQTSEFLDEVRKQHDFSKESIDVNVVWLSDQNMRSRKSPLSKSEATKPIIQNTDILHTDQECPDKQINKITTPPMAEMPYDDESGSFNNLKAPDNEQQVRKNIISKIKGVISQNKSDQTAIFYYDIDFEKKEGVNLKEKPIQSSNSEVYLVESPKFQESNLSSADFNPAAPRQKKKVTFSYTDHPETLCIVEHQRDHSDSSYPIESPSGSEEPIETIKPQAAPRKQVAKKVKAIYIDSAEIFKQNKERFLIEETQKFLQDHKMHQNQQWSEIQNFGNDKEKQGALNKPKTIQRTKESVTESPVTSQQTSPSGKAFIDERRNLILFLDDHQAYHNKERSNHIGHISKQNKPYINDPKSSTKETKIKTKLISKLKSLVGQSQENIAPDRIPEIENANLRKQTSEFLISQKCYNDLEGVACKKFDMKQLEKEKLSKNYVKGEHSAEVSSDQIASHNSTLKKDSTFCYPRKLSVDGCPESPTKSQKPLTSSPAKKISKTENITLKETDSDINHKRGDSNEDSSTNHLITIEQTMNFLNTQRNHINSENEIWKHYLKFKPLPDSDKSHIHQKRIGKSHSKVQHRIQKPETSTRKLSSQLESEKIDHEVVLHKTQLFLEDHKTFHDNLQKESSKHISKNATQNFVGEKFQEKEGSASTKIEPLPPLRSTSYLSSNVQKPEIFLQKHEENVKITKSNDSNDESSRIKEDEIKEITKNFLKDHQDYHNSERVETDDRCKENQKQKKSKRGVISKIKSLVTGDSHKKNSSKPTMRIPSPKPNDEMGLETPTKKEDIIIRELESSPATYRRHKPQSKANEETLKNPIDDSGKISDQNDSKSSRFSDLVSQNDDLDKRSAEKSTIATHGETFGAVKKEDISSRNLYYNQVKCLPEDERKKYAFAKLSTQEFLLNQKEFSNILKSGKEQKNSAKSGENDYNSQPKAALEQQLETKKIGSVDFSEEGTGLLPSAPPLEQMDQRDIENTETVIHRVVKPLSPTKTIFQEIRVREESPDRQVYIMKEGYKITKENKENVKSNKGERIENLERRRMFTSIEERSQKDEYQDHAWKNPVCEEISKGRSGKISSVHSDGSPPINTRYPTEGQDYVDRSNDSPSHTVPPQGDLEVRRSRTKNCYFIFLVVLVVSIVIHLLFREDDDEN